uniref:Uncharacterized protein n=1 Tax=Vitis vinifera TaxID=29760 RepID=F6I6Y9_VITVI
MYLFDMHHFH